MSIAIHDRVKDEDGFTLIELLVVVIIIGILAAIAIPTFLNQRERGWQAELTSSVRNAALEVEAAATQAGGDYPATASAPVLTQFTAGGDVTLTYESAATTAFTIEGTHADINGGVNCLIYNSATGGVGAFAETACP